ncbi:MAG: hypothetical protein JWP26_3934 [Devosia sp.]|nr:hypothetical protein [Devosia sp.]
MTPTEQINQLIASLSDWRGTTLASIRQTILAADPEIIEEWKWMGSPVWSRDGIIAVGNAHKDKIKLTFSHGADLPDPDKLFNAGLDGKGLARHRYPRGRHDRPGRLAGPDPRGHRLQPGQTQQGVGSKAQSGLVKYGLSCLAGAAALVSPRSAGRDHLSSQP